MELVTVLTPGAFNAVKFIILYLFVDHVMVWAKAKLKRSVNVSDLIDAIPVHIDSIKDNGGRTTISGIINNLVWLLYLFPKQLFANTGGHGLHRQRRRVLLRIMGRLLEYIFPIFLFGSLFALEYGTGEKLRCKHDAVQFQPPATYNGIFQGSLACTRLQSIEQQKGPAVSMHVEYSRSYLHNGTVYCGCAEWTEKECISQYNANSVSRQMATWETTIGSLQQPNSIDVLASRVRKILEVRREFSFPTVIPWKAINDSGQEKLDVYCYYYSGKTRNSAACIRRNDNNIGNVQSRDVLMIAETNRSLSLIYTPVPNANQSDMATLSGIIDGPRYSHGYLVLVYRTTSENILRVGTFNGSLLFAGIFQTLLFYRLWSWNVNLESSIAAEFSKVITAIAGVRREGTGTLTTCSGTVLTLKNGGIIASFCLLALLTMSFCLSISTTPENLWSFFTRGKALESDEWAINALLSQTMRLGTLWQGDPVEAVTILERNGNQMNMSITDPGNAGVTCNPAEIPRIP